MLPWHLNFIYDFDNLEILFTFVLPEHGLEWWALQLLDVIKQLVGYWLQILFLDATRAFNHVGIPCFFVHYFIGGINCHCSQETGFSLKHAVVEQHEVTEHLRNHFLLLVVVRYESISLHEPENWRPYHIKVQAFKDFGFQLTHLRTSDCVVYHLENCFQLLWIDLLVFASDMERRYPKALEINFFEILPPH